MKVSRGVCWEMCVCAGEVGNMGVLLCVCVWMEVCVLGDVGVGVDGGVCVGVDGVWVCFCVWG